MDPTLQPRIFTFYFFSLYFHDPPDPPDLPTYLVFFPARLARARMDGRARGVRYRPRMSIQTRVKYVFGETRCGLWDTGTPGRRYNVITALHLTNIRFLDIVLS